MPKKQFVELRDSDGRPDAVVAEEAWNQHLARDHSIITDLFYGQLKSKVYNNRCIVAMCKILNLDDFLGYMSNVWT